MSDPAVDAVHARVLAMSSSHRPFVLPILRAIQRLGGTARKKLVTEELRRLLADVVEPATFEELVRRERFGWTRLDLKHFDLVGGEAGTWALTDLGRRYVESLGDEPFSIPALRFEEQRQEKNVVVDTVPATTYRAYALPALQALEQGEMRTRDLVKFVGERLHPLLLPGDLGRLPNGSLVWHARLVWELSHLKAIGEANNVRPGVWAITDLGRQRLARKEPWSIDGFARSQATIVRNEAATDPVADDDETVAAPPAPLSLEARWARFLEGVDGELAAALRDRLRIDRGPLTSMPRNIILYGPPGTGKTHLARRITDALVGDDDDEQAMLVQFHPSYGYEDFVQGLRPDLRGSQLHYALQPGPFLQIVEAATEAPTRLHVLVIDEINRGDPARIFGELLFALEYRDTPISLAAGGLLSVPSNLVIIGTMNSVDRSVALVDYALRRRFGFVRVDPDAGVIETVHGDTLLGNAGGVVLDRFNEWITRRLGADHTIGHSYFISKSLDADDPGVFARLWKLDLRPLLEEYFFGDADGLREAEARWQAIVAEAVVEAAVSTDGA